MIRLRHAGWAKQEFGHAVLGDKRRVHRLVALADGMAGTPAGTLTEVFEDSASREGAYRLLENPAVHADAMATARNRAAANRCFGERLVFVPVDGSSLNLRDRLGRRGMGDVGAKGRGLHVMSAIAVRQDGLPMGVCGQRYWAQQHVGIKRGEYDSRPLGERQSRYWTETMAQVLAVFGCEAPSTRPWFQLDRGGDVGNVMKAAVSTNRAFLTVRSTHNRRLTGLRGRQQYLWDHLRRKEPQGSYVLPIPAGEHRSARLAHLHVRFCPVTLDVKNRTTGRHDRLQLWAVRVGEIDSAPAGEAPLDWLLLTTYPVEVLDDAVLVINGYATRWRIEDFHKIWKSGACRVEDTQLQKREHVEKFAVVSASVAMRIQRLTHLARTTPDEPATVELSRPEIDATILLRRPKGYVRGQTPTIGEAVRWIADLGGFMGPSPNNKNATRKPGAIVIGRGLNKIETVAELLARGEM